MASPATLSNFSSASYSTEATLIDRNGIVNKNSPIPFSEVNVSHFNEITIMDDWGEVKLTALLKNLYRRFQATSPEVEVKALEVGSSAAYDAYHPHREAINKTLPKSLADKADEIDLSPSFDRDTRFKVHKDAVGRAEEFFLAALKEECPNFNSGALKWKEKIYDYRDNVFILSIRDKKGDQFDFNFYAETKREFFASRDAAQVDFTPFLKEGKQATLIVNHYHPLQPYVDRIERKLRIPDPEGVNHQGFLLYLYYMGIKGYRHVEEGVETILKNTLLAYFKTSNCHSISELLAKFITNHPFENNFSFIFSVQNRLGYPITSPFKELPASHLRVCAQLTSPIDRKIVHAGQTLLLDVPTVADAKEFQWDCPLLQGHNILDAILQFEEREPLNPAAKAMFDSYASSLQDEQRTAALKKRVVRFAPTNRRAHVLMQTISRAPMSPDLFNVVAHYSDANQWGLLISGMSNETWIKSNQDKAIEVYKWLIENRNKERVYFFLSHLISSCNPAQIESFVKEAWRIHPHGEEMRELKEELGKRGIILSSLFSPLELLSLIRPSDKDFPTERLNDIVKSARTEHYGELLSNLPYTWLASNPEKASEVFDWILKEKRIAYVYPFLQALIMQCAFIDPKEAALRAWRALPSLDGFLTLPVETSQIAPAMLETLSKDKGQDYIAYLHHLIAVDAASAVPNHAKRLWEIDQDLAKILMLAPILAKRALKLDCLLPTLEKELSKPISKALHDMKKAFDPLKFSRLVEMGHLNHIDNLVHIAIHHPEWIKTNPRLAFELFLRLIQQKKPGTILQYMPPFFANGDTNDFQECVKGVWPLLCDIRPFLDVKSALKQRGVSVAVIFRPLEADVLQALLEKQGKAAQAIEFFGRLESAAGKRSYLTLLSRENIEEAIAYAKENQMETDLLEIAKAPLPIRVLNGKTKWTKEECGRLWTLAEKTLQADLIAAVLPHDRTGFKQILDKAKDNPQSLSSLYPEIVREPISTALPYVLSQTEISEMTRAELPRLLKEGTIENRLTLLSWAKSKGHPIKDYIALDADIYRDAFRERLSNQAKFNELYILTGRGPFDRLWESLSSQEREELVRLQPHIFFKREELRPLLEPFKDALFEALGGEASELLNLGPSKKEHYYACFRSAASFEAHYPAFVAAYGSSLTPEEWNRVVDWLIQYKSKHILTASRHVCDGNAKRYIDAGIPLLGPMQSEDEKNFYAFANAQKYTPQALIKHLLHAHTYAWFKKGLDPLLLQGNPSVDMARDALKGVVRFEHEFTPDDLNTALTYLTHYAGGHFPVIECLQDAVGERCRRTCFSSINAILDDWSKNPANRSADVEASIGTFVIKQLERSPKDTVEYVVNELGLRDTPFPKLEQSYQVPLHKALIRRAKEEKDANGNLLIANNFTHACKSDINRNPTLASNLIDDYVSLIVDAIDLQGNPDKIKFFIYSFLFMLIRPEWIDAPPAELKIPPLKSIERKENALIGVTYVKKLLDALLVRKERKQEYLLIILEASHLLIQWLINAPEQAKSAIPCLEKRIYYMNPSPDFLFSESILQNKALLLLVERSLSVAQRTEFMLACNVKVQDAAPKNQLADRMKGYNNYARQFLAMENTRATQHVLNTMGELLPHYKYIKTLLNIKEIFLGIMTRAAMDPTAQTASGAQFAIRLKDILCDYAKAMHEEDRSARNALLPAFLELYRQFTLTLSLAIGSNPDLFRMHLSDFLTRIEYENFIAGHYEAYFDMCDIILPAYAGTIEDTSAQVLDPMSVLILTQWIDPQIFSPQKGEKTQDFLQRIKKILPSQESDKEYLEGLKKRVEAILKRQKRTLEKWFQTIQNAHPQWNTPDGNTYVKNLVKEFDAIEAILSVKD